jgi:hypothetical protein
MTTIYDALGSEESKATFTSLLEGIDWTNEDAWRGLQEDLAARGVDISLLS